MVECSTGSFIATHTSKTCPPFVGKLLSEGLTCTEWINTAPVTTQDVIESRRWQHSVSNIMCYSQALQPITALLKNWHFHYLIDEALPKLNI